MRNLFLFLFRFRGALVFGLLEIISIYLFVTNNSYQRAAFFNSANAYAGVVLERRTQITDYFHLAELNKQLVAENAVLRQQLYPPDTVRREADSVAVPPARTDSLQRVRYQRPATRPDTLLLGLQRLAARDPSYPLIPARVINNRLSNVDNFFTLNVGTANGVQRGLGVVAAGGVAGRVQAVTEHYATVASLLHSKTTIASKIKRDGTFGTIKWLGDDPTHAVLDNVLRETKLVKGDTVVTSGYNAVFPEGIFIGTIESFVKEPDKNFWTIRVRLGVNFSNLTYVYVVTSRPKAERDTVEARAGMLPEGGKRK
ncbi:rod shape-determining protein MreC [Hymenobacter properus]|uniref:Cell shape-determining protein MreC n=1 Tax=Hymenobacter properus TaxID=2791026 RepID=A0A931FKC1_9BACT|nr:rod shape-determining protein MreC [Hymenobacter properus]MBF9143802.1 rod shape-determining protein MreC [Hymenobacter properus]MBR7722615.1 rod shape-determining protein MreC [Microvirga sp. SRT04]